MIKCSFCGHSFDPEQAKSCCSGCPMQRTCNKHKCPNCDFEIPKEPGLIKFIKRKWGKNHDHV